MAIIEPFLSIHYNPESIEDISKVVCPPYDVIDSLGQEAYYQKHPYNMIRLILGKDFSSDTPKENQYTRAADYIEEWQRRNILIRDQESSIYFYEQTFVTENQKKRRVGFIALMKLDEEGAKRSVHPHEHTHTAPKEDRLKLIKSVEANLSPIFTIFSDPKEEIKAIFEETIKKEPPLFEVKDDQASTEDRIWRLSQKSLIDSIKAFLSQRDVFIADGHHRYEVAKSFRDEKRSLGAQHFKDSYNYIMTYFTALEDEGLCILPTHRLVRNVHFGVQDITSCFSVKQISSREILISEMKEKSGEVGVFGLYLKNQFYLLRLNEKRECNRFIQEGPKEYKNLDVVILHKVLFDNILKIALSQISYEVNLDHAVKLVDDKIYDALFLLNPTKIEQIRSIALSGEVMPQKSTYFYPKLLSGFLIHRF